MPELSRTQLAVYGAIAVALLFVGARAVRGESGGGAAGDSGYTSSYGDHSSESGGEDGTEGGDGGEATFPVEGSGSDVVVDVTGAVRRPGVYRLPAGSRVDDAVKRAGGASGRAALSSINLAARLADGQQVAVPEDVASAAGRAGPTAGAAAATGGAEGGPISLATASAAELDTIDGIGPVTAEDIINFREERGGLASVDQLDQISGVGPATMEALRGRLQP